MSFADDVSNWADKANIARDEVIKAGIIEIGSYVIRKTPRDTGAARNNWFSSIGTESNGSQRGPDTSGAAAQANLEGIAAQSPGKVYVMINNLPYVTLLEYGSSTQAPLGMVRQAIAKYRRAVKSISRL